MFDIIYVDPKVKGELIRQQKRLGFDTINDYLKHLASQIKVNSATESETKEK